MKMRKLFLLTLIYSCCLIEATFGCECTNVSYKFMDKIETYSFVAMVEVVGRDTLPKNETSPLKEYGFTVVRIINQYSGEPVGKKIKIIEGKGYECFVKLRFKNIGDRFIVKGKIKDVNDYIFIDWDKQLPQEDIAVLSLCDTHQLSVKDNKVSGWITKGIRPKKQQWNSFLRKISFGWIDKEDDNQNFKLQQMSLHRFKRILKKRVR